MFKDAPVLANKAKAPKKKDDKKEVAMVGLYDYAMVDGLVKNLDTVHKTIARMLKNTARDLFIKDGKNGKPDNFRGIEDTATASVELRRRGANAPLTPEERLDLDEAGIPYGKVVDVTATFVINPEYLEDVGLMKRVEKALEAVKGLPDDFILKQEAVTRYVATDETLDEVLKKAPDLIATTAIIALKPKVENFDITKALDVVKKYVDIPELTEGKKTKAKVK